MAGTVWGQARAMPSRPRSRGIILVENPGAAARPGTPSMLRATDGVAQRVRAGLPGISLSGAERILEA